MKLLIVAYFFSLVFLCYGIKKGWTDEEETAEYWYKLGQEELDEALKRENLNMNVARNVIIFLGDGMGLPTITAGRILKGQMQGQSGEEFTLAMDTFPHVGFSKTYSVDRDVTDSASSATAFLCGVKTNYHTIGVNGKVMLSDCASQEGGANNVVSVLEDSFAAGKACGLISTTPINHATPGGTFAHTPDRSWYSDSHMPQEAKDLNCKDIAQQFYDAADKITVALGGGRQYFTPNTTQDEEYPDQYGDREDGQNLIQMWINKYKANGDGYAKYVMNKTAFDEVDPIATTKLLGMFERAEMQYEVDRDMDKAGEPSLPEMTEKAIRMLQKESNGYFLLVEGAQIDYGHHDSSGYEALHEFVMFDNAIEKALELTSETDTLIVVTADHSHTFSLGGYSYRGNPIFGLAPDNDDPSMAYDLKPMTSLLYGNGPGYQGTGDKYDQIVRQRLTYNMTSNRNYQQQSGWPAQYETHGGEDVAILAHGPMAHLFHGIHEESYIAYVMRYASCVGSDQGHCNGESDISTTPDPEKTTTAKGIVTTTGKTPTQPESNHTVIPIYSFLGYNLDGTEAMVALYCEFVLVLNMAFTCLYVVAMCIHKKKNATPLKNKKYKMNEAVSSHEMETKIGKVNNTYVQPL